MFPTTETNGPFRWLPRSFDAVQPDLANRGELVMIEGDVGPARPYPLVAEEPRE